MKRFLRFLGAGEFFGEMALLDRAPRSATVRSLEDTRVLALGRTDFLSIMLRNEAVVLAVIEELSRRLREADEQASSLSFLCVKDRAQQFFQRQAQHEFPGGRLATPSLTHQQIADMIGTSRETVTRVVKDLKQAGWLAPRG